MDSEPLMTALHSVIHRLVILATEDAQLRCELRRFAQAVLDLTGVPEQQAASELVAAASPGVQVVELPPPVVEVAPAVLPPPEPPLPPVVLPALTLGQPKPTAEPAPVSYPERWARIADLDLSLIESRCRLKTEGARWAATRRRLLAEGANFRTEIEPMDQDIISRAKAIPDCFLWMCHPTGPSPADIATVEELVNDGMPASNREIRELLAPIIDDLPELAEVPPGFQAVLGEIDRLMATYPPPETKAVKPPTHDVLEVASRLKDKSLIMIGGDRREGASETIKEAFGLKELFWLDTREHESFVSFEPYVARPEVAAVLLAIRWSSHSYGEVNDFCERYGKPLVRLPGGYGLNQVAAQIMRQCSERLPLQEPGSVLE